MAATNLNLKQTGAPSGDCQASTFHKKIAYKPSTETIMGASELLVLLGIPLLIILPIWMSFRIYKNDLTLWKQLSCVASLFGSWIGFIIVRCVHQAYKGYQDQERANLNK